MAGKKQCPYTPAQLEEMVESYFAYCRSTEEESAKSRQCPKPPTMEGLGAYLQLSRRTLSRYLLGEYPGTATQKRQVADCMERAKDYMTAATLEGALLGKYDSRICTMILQDMGYGSRAGERAGVLRVEWKGIGAEALKQWSE